MTPEAAFVFFGLISAVFGLAYFPVLNRMARGLASPYAKADLGKRSVAAVIDAGLVASCVIAFAVQGSPLFMLLAVIYVLLRDALFVPGQSIGKFLAGLVVINLDNGRPCGRLQSAKRNFIFVVPGLNVVVACTEVVTTFRDPQGQRLSDRIANTQVVEGLGAREFVREVQNAVADLEFARRGEEEPVEVK